MAIQALVVTKDMTIGEIVSKYPQTAGVMQGFGLHCIGCHVNPFETLEQGALGHEMPKEVFEEMLKEVNKVVSENPGAGPAKKQQESKEIQPLTLTKNAIEKLAGFRDKEGKNHEWGLRVAAMPGGCAGFQYHLEFDRSTKYDVVTEQDGMKVIVASEQVEMLSGVRIDYVDSLEGSGFKIENPNSTASCGCGKSFH